jgi:PHD/YefM family antitoxin component YafN of YafNO toxin-antitoxin module
MVRENSMELNEIKKIIEEEGGKIVLAQDNGPTLIIMKLEDYRGKKEAKAETKNEQISKNPREFEVESLKIDDLPF